MDTLEKIEIVLIIIIIGLIIYIVYWVIGLMGRCGTDPLCYLTGSRESVQTLANSLQKSVVKFIDSHVPTLSGIYNNVANNLGWDE